MRAYGRYMRWGVVMSCAVALALVLAAGANQAAPAPESGVAFWLTDWTDGTGAAVDLPSMLGTGGVTLSRRLPDALPANFVVYADANYQRVRALVDGVEIPVRGMPEKTLLSLPNDCPWTALSLPAEAAGKTLTLIFAGGGSKARVEVYRVLAGLESDIRFFLLDDALPTLVVCAFMALVACALFAYATLKRLRGEAPTFARLTRLSAFSALSTAWMFTDTSIQGAYFVGSEAFFLANLFSYMLMPLPFLLLVRGEDASGRHAVDLGVGLVLAEVVINGVMMALGCYRLYWTLASTHVALALAICFALAQSVRDNLRGRDTSHRETLLSLCALGLTGLGAMVQFYAAANPDNTLLFRYGILLFVTVLGVDAVKSGAMLLSKARNYEQLRIREEEYRIAAEHSGKMILRYDIDTRTVYHQANAALELRLPAVLEDVPDSLIALGIVDPECVQELRRFFREIQSGQASGTSIARIRRKNGDYRWYRADYTTIFSESGAPVQAIISYYDTTDLREKEMAFEKWQQSYDSLPREKINYYEYNLTRDTFDREEGGMLPPVDPAVPRTLSDIALYTAQHYAYPEDRTKFLEFYARNRLLACYYGGLRSEQMLLRRMGEGGEPLWTMASVQLIPDPYSSDVKAFILLQDIDREKRAELLEEARKNQDPLTALLNRGAFIERVTSLFSGAENCVHALVMIDIDDFKQVNDTFGHQVGDQTLMRVADGLRRAVRENDLLSRLGGDEFILCLQDVPPGREALERRLAALCASLNQAGTSPCVSASLGAALYPRDGRSFDELYQKADKALYAAKHRGKRQYVFYTPEIEGGEM